MDDIMADRRKMRETAVSMRIAVYEVGKNKGECTKSYISNEFTKKKNRCVFGVYITKREAVAYAAKPIAANPLRRQRCVRSLSCCGS